jgi:hypothetical protein
MTKATLSVGALLTVAVAPAGTQIAARLSG